MNHKIIAAVDESWGIGKNGEIPWYEPQDFKFYSTMTSLSTCVYGRKTYEDILNILEKRNVDHGEFLLKNKRSIVISRSIRPIHTRKYVDFCGSVPAAVKLFDQYQDYNSQLYFCGGSAIYSEALDLCDVAYLTHMRFDSNCTTFFPKEKFLDLYKESAILDKNNACVWKEWVRK